MTCSEDTLLLLADAIKRATGASLNQTDIAAELERIKVAYLPPVQTPRNVWVSK